MVPCSLALLPHPRLRSVLRLARLLPLCCRSRARQKPPSSLTRQTSSPHGRVCTCKGHMSFNEFKTSFWERVWTGEPVKDLGALSSYGVDLLAPLSPRRTALDLKTSQDFDRLEKGAPTARGFPEV